MKNWSLWIGLLLLGFMLFISFVGPQFDFVDDTAPEHRMRFYEDGGIGRAPFPPSSEDIFGTDREARDILSMLIIGAKDTFKIILLITVIRYLIAIPMAFFASTKKGLAYLVTNGWYSLFGSIPTIFAAILLLEIFSKNSSGNWVYWNIVIIALIEVGRVSYIFSNEMYEISQKEFVKASRTIGTTPFQLSILHYLPSITQNVVVNFFNDLARVTLLVGQLALFEYFIENIIQYIPGGGAFQDEAGYFSATGVYDWFGLLSAARYEIIKAPWIVLFPALAITGLLLTFQLLSEGCRKLFDQKATRTKSAFVGRVFESVGETLVSSRKVGSVVVLALLVFVGGLIITGKEVSVTSSTDIASGEETVNVEEVTETEGEDVEDESSESDTNDPFGDGKYQFDNGKLIATTESTTQLGGYYDKLSFIEQNMTKLSEREFETESIVLTCRTIGAERCEDPLIGFKNPPATVGEAYDLLKAHLPLDVGIEGEKQRSETEYEYLLSSKLSQESYSQVDYSAGSIRLKFEISPEGTIVKARIE